MLSQGLIYAVSAGITVGIQLCGFAVAYAKQTETFYDILGGVNYLALAVWSAAAKGTDFGDDPRKIIMTALFCASRSWLLLFLAWRAHERKGDSRFDDFKSKFFIFMGIWLIQGMWVFFISLPMIFVNSSSHVTPISGALDWIAIIGFGVSVLMEIAADVQKAVWVRNGRKGGFCTVGVWYFSRHPNYFGEIFQWWCAWMLAYGSAKDGASDWLWWVCIISPLFTMQILLNQSGTGLVNAEGQSLKRYYDKYEAEYTKYRKSTSILIPMIGYQYVPLFLKQTIFLDWKRYEYNPSLDTTTTENDDKKNESNYNSMDNIEPIPEVAATAEP
eukprot:scaffold24318_cov52-Attheya_sp.AAC.3